MVDDTPHILIEKELLVDVAFNSKAMLIHFYGRPVTRHNIISWIKCTWSLRNTFRVGRREKYSFTMDLNSKEDTMRVLKEEWSWYNSILVRTTIWKVTMVKGANISNMPIWMYLPNLPKKFWSKEFLSRVASILGTPLSGYYLFIGRRPWQ